MFGGCVGIIYLFLSPLFLFETVVLLVERTAVGVDHSSPKQNKAQTRMGKLKDLMVGI